MLFNYIDYCYLVPYIVVFTYSWIFFIKSNFMSTRVHQLRTDKIQPSQVIKKIHFSTFIKININQLVILYLNFYFIKGHESVFLWNHLVINNNNLYIIYTIVIMLLLFNILLNTLISNNVNYNSDFFFAINNISIFLIILYFTNTIFSFIFLLEVVSVTVFYKFIMSRLWYKPNPSENSQKFDLTTKNLPKNYLNMLFFQYWSTFFSSFLLFFSLINIHFMYGLSEYTYITILSNISNNLSLDNTIQIVFIWLPFVLGVFFKIGLTPFHLFKIEVYKGLPIISILFYTTFYFFVYFLYFSILLLHHIGYIKVYINTFLFLILLCGILYVVCLLFDLTSVKSFFAYSTVINVILFFTLIVLF